MIIHILLEQKTLPVPIGYCIPWITGAENKLTVVMQCSVCNRHFSLANHTIIKGQVSPSVVCPYNCSFHESIQIVK